VLITTFGWFTMAACAADMPALDPKDPRFKDRKALRDLLTATEQAFNKADVEAVIGVLDKDAVVVWQDGVRTASHDELRQHYKQTFQGPGAILRSLDIKASLAGPARFYGANQAIAYGNTKEAYQLIGGGSVALDGLWTTHVVKQDGKWKVTALHFSTNPFDNEVIRKAGRLWWYVGAGGLSIGLLVGWLFGRRRKV
jgi:uncharacterized protein (TIGR02246 family)